MITIQSDLFEFAYVPDWYRHLHDLKCMALPEAWQFKKPAVETKNAETPILERYIHTIFRKQAIEFNSEQEYNKALKYFYIENECACFHTGLYTPSYKGIYGCFFRNKKQDSMLEWYFKGFCDEMSPWLKYIEPLPERPVYHMAQQGLNFNPEWSIRVNVEHILGDEENLNRIWNRFYKADESRHREDGGTGIGLAFVKAIMGNYDNKYGVKNLENGVEFYFELDLRQRG